jgi:hypothetical protein
MAPPARRSGDAPHSPRLRHEPAPGRRHRRMHDRSVARSGAHVGQHGEQASRSTSLAPTGPTVSPSTRGMMKSWPTSGAYSSGTTLGRFSKGTRRASSALAPPGLHRPTLPRSATAPRCGRRSGSSLREAAPEACREKKKCERGGSPCPALA